MDAVYAWKFATDEGEQKGDDNEKPFQQKPDQRNPVRGAPDNGDARTRLQRLCNVSLTHFVGILPGTLFAESVTSQSCLAEALFRFSISRRDTSRVARRQKRNSQAYLRSVIYKFSWCILPNALVASFSLRVQFKIWYDFINDLNLVYSRNLFGDNFRTLVFLSSWVSIAWCCCWWWWWWGGSMACPSQSDIRGNEGSGLSLSNLSSRKFQNIFRTRSLPALNV